MTAHRSRRPASSTRARLAAPVVLAAVLVALVGGLLAPTSAGAAGPAAPAGRTAAERAGSGPSYGPWSSYFYDLRARASAPTKKRKRAHVQVERTTNPSGDRQLQLRWKPAGRAQRSTVVKSVAPGGRITFATAALPCGRTTLTLRGRGRAPGGSWGQWQAISADVRRPC